MEDDVNSADPATWAVPVGWAPLREGVWELEQLRIFAIALLARDPTYGVLLDPFEDGYLKVDVFLRDTKVGEVFVNRGTGERGGAVYRLFVGHEGLEQDVHGVQEALDRVLAAQGAWRDHQGGRG